MKQIVILFLLCSIGCMQARERVYAFESIPYKNREARKKPGLDNKTRAILAQFASIIMGFLGIVQDPNNASNVAAHVTDMVNNAVNIVTEAVKSGELSLNADEQELQAFAERVVKSKCFVAVR